MPQQKWTLVEMVRQWQRCMDGVNGCLITRCPLDRKVIVETAGDVGVAGTDATISFQGCSLVGTLDELVKSGWSRKPFREPH